MQLARIRISLFFIALFLTITACEDLPTDKESETVSSEGLSEEATDDSESEELLAMEEETPPIDQAVFDSLVLQWNEALNSKSVPQIADVYGRKINYYGNPRANSTYVTKDKYAFFQRNKDFKQEVETPVVVKQIKDDLFQCNFDKKVWAKGQIQTYPAYLVFKQLEEKYLIVVESDGVTDENLLKRNKKKQKQVNTKEELKPEDGIRGDFDGDGHEEYAWLLPPKTKDMDCEGPCECTITFSNDDISPVTIGNCIGGYPQNEGDLNGDGSDEISLIPHWFTSCWQAMYLFTYQKNKWPHLVSPLSVYVCDGKDIDRVQQLEKGKLQLIEDGMDPQIGHTRDTNIVKVKHHGSH